MDRRAELFPPDRKLQAWMMVAVLTAAATTVLAIVVVAWLTVVVEWRLGLFVALFAITGFIAGPGKHLGAKPARTSPVSGRDERVPRQLVTRLAVLGGLRAPRVSIEPDPTPMSWTTALPRRRPTIHVTAGLMAVCDARELEAVLAHELSHIAHHDAWVMTVVAGPPTWILTGIRAYWAERKEEGDSLYRTFRYALGVVLLGSWMAALALPGALAARLVSRQRELAADRGAARLTGSPAAVAAALNTLSGRLAAPGADLRVAARLALLNFVPHRAHEARGPARLWATHPPLQQRLAELERMERALQAAA